MSIVIIRRLFLAGFAAGLWLAEGHALAQSTLALKPALDEAGAVASPQLEIDPIEQQAAPRFRRTAPEDPYAPQGLRLGGILLFPSLNSSAVYSSNVNQAATNPRDGAGLRLRPSLRFESDWVRHSWTGRIAGDFTRYLEGEAEDANGIDAAQNFRLDIRRTTRAEFASSYVLDQTDLGDSEIPAAAIGSRTDQTVAASASLVHDFGGFEGRLRSGVTRRVFGDVDLSGGGVEDNSDRDYAEPSLALRLTYTDPPAIKPYVEAGYAPRFHDRAFDRNGLRRDSDGISAAIGAVIEAGPMFNGDLAAVYRHRTYDDPALADADALAVEGHLTWAPRQHTTLTLTLATELNETASATSSGTPTYTARIDASHGLRENLEISAHGEIEIEDVEGAGASTAYDAGLGASWTLNPYLAWTLGYDFTLLDGVASGSGYTEHRVSTGITVSR